MALGEWRRLLQEALRLEGLPWGGGEPPEAAPPSAAYLEGCLGAGREPSGEGGSRSRLPVASSLRTPLELSCGQAAGCWGT